MDRVSFTYETNAKQKFLLSKKEFTQQFSGFYFARLKQLRSVLEPKLTQYNLIDKIVDLKSEEKCALIGTIYKEMKLKPNVLVEYTRDKLLEEEDTNIVVGEDTDESKKTTNLHRVSNEDGIVLEDEYARVNLKFIHDHIATMNDLVTGVVVGVVGQEHAESGDFMVEQIIYPYEVTTNTTTNTTMKSNGKYICFLSGFTMNHSLEMAIDYLNGWNASQEEVQSFLKNVVRVCWMGANSMDTIVDSTMELFDHQQSKSHPNYQLIDSAMESLVQTIDVDVIPSFSECLGTNVSLPQQPIYKAFLPKSSIYQTCHLVTNPYEFKIDDCKILVLPQESLQDIRLYSSKTSDLQIVKQLLTYGHICPTAPDTLDCYAFTDKDPFVLTEHYAMVVCTSAHCNTVQYEMIQWNQHSTLLVIIPYFTKSNQLVFVNINNNHDVQIKQII